MAVEYKSFDLSELDKQWIDTEKSINESRLFMLDPGRLRMEKVRKQDIVKIADGLFNVTYRFTVLPESDYQI